MDGDVRSGDPLADLVVTATQNGDGADSAAAVDSLAVAREPEPAPAQTQAQPSMPVQQPVAEVRIGGTASKRQPEVLTAPVEGVGTRSQPRNKAEAMQQLEQANSQIASLNDRLKVLEARTDTKALADLGGVIAVAVRIVSKFAAANRGPHWQIDSQDSESLGEAYAAALAPYASYLKSSIPWALALALTWKVLEPRLEKDAQLKAAAASGEPKPDSGDSKK